MNTTDPLHPEILPQSEGPLIPEVTSEQPMPAVTPPKPAAPPKRNFKVWIAVGAIAIVILVVSAIFGASQTTTTPGGLTPTPTFTATTTAPNRPLSPIATDSAFLKLEADWETINKGAQSIQIQNSQLLPPRLDLPLGFSR